MIPCLLNKEFWNWRFCCHLLLFLNFIELIKVKKARTSSIDGVFEPMNSSVSILTKLGAKRTLLKSERKKKIVEVAGTHCEKRGLGKLNAHMALKGEGETTNNLPNKFV